MTDDQRLDRILEVEAFIASCRRDGRNGALWARVPGDDAAPHTLYHGSAGIAVFYLELHRCTGTPRFLDEAVSAADEVLALIDDPGAVTIGIYSGLPGYTFVLNEVAKASGEARLRAGATRAVEKLADQARPLGSGIGWIEAMPFSDITGMTGDRELLDLSIGSAGAGLGLLYAHRHGLESRSLELATQTADRLLDMSVDTADGRNWPMMADMPFPFTAPNFAHGAAGVGYFLADLYRATDEPRYLDAAVSAAGFVEAHATSAGDNGVLVCHTEEQPDLHYLGVCHGPPGSGRLMYLLQEITGDDAWSDWLHANMRGLLATGAPESRSDGLWQNYGQCCGDAGIGDYALSLYRAGGGDEYLDLARRIETVLLANSHVEHGRRSWAQAEHRSRPDFVETQTGYMQGAAGIGSFLMHLATIDDITTAKISMPDSPFDD